MNCPDCGRETYETDHCSCVETKALRRRASDQRAIDSAKQETKLKKKHAELAAELQAIDAMVHVDRPEARVWEDEEEDEEEEP